MANVSGFTSVQRDYELKYNKYETGQTEQSLIACTLTPVG
jgi:hypothetical protein